MTNNFATRQIKEFTETLRCPTTILEIAMSTDIQTSVVTNFVEKNEAVLTYNNNVIPLIFLETMRKELRELLIDSGFLSFQHVTKYVQSRAKSLAQEFIRREIFASVLECSKAHRHEDSLYTVHLKELYELCFLEIIEDRNEPVEVNEVTLEIIDKVKAKVEVKNSLHFSNPFSNVKIIDIMSGVSAQYGEMTKCKEYFLPTGFIQLRNKKILLAFNKSKCVEKILLTDLHVDNQVEFLSELCSEYQLKDEFIPLENIYVLSEVVCEVNNAIVKFLSDDRANNVSFTLSEVVSIQFSTMDMKALLSKSTCYIENGNLLLLVEDKLLLLSSVKKLEKEFLATLSIVATDAADKNSSLKKLTKKASLHASFKNSMKASIDRLKHHSSNQVNLSNELLGKIVEFLRENLEKNFRELYLKRIDQIIEERHAKAIAEKREQLKDSDKKDTRDFTSIVSIKKEFYKLYLIQETTSNMQHVGYVIIFDSLVALNRRLNVATEDLEMEQLSANMLSFQAFIRENIHPVFYKVLCLLCKLFFAKNAPEELSSDNDLSNLSAKEFCEKALLKKEKYSALKSIGKMTNTLKDKERSFDLESYLENLEQLCTQIGGLRLCRPDKKEWKNKLAQIDLLLVNKLRSKDYILSVPSIVDRSSLLASLALLRKFKIVVQVSGTESDNLLFSLAKAARLSEDDFAALVVNVYGSGDNVSEWEAEIRTLYKKS